MRHAVRRAWGTRKTWAEDRRWRSRVPDYVRFGWKADIAVEDGRSLEGVLDEAHEIELKFVEAEGRFI